MSKRNGYVYRGIHSGSNYDLSLRLTGYGATFFRKAASSIPLQSGMRVLDLGCGTAAFGLAIAARWGPGLELYGIDLSSKQLSHANAKADRSGAPFRFCQGSMGALPFKPGMFDAVIASLVFVAVPANVRRAAIPEVARVLKPKGIFALVDWSRPRFGIHTVVSLLSFLIFAPDWRDHWNNVYPGLCSGVNLMLDKDCYLNSLIRCQVFRKA